MEGGVGEGETEEGRKKGEKVPFMSPLAFVDEGCEGPGLEYLHIEFFFPRG